MEDLAKGILIGAVTTAIALRPKESLMIAVGVLAAANDPETRAFILSHMPVYCPDHPMNPMAINLNQIPVCAIAECRYGAQSLSEGTYPESFA